MSSVDPTITPFEAFGGHAFFDRLVAAFYGRVETDPVLRPMYPGSELAPARERLRLFLEQYWGGPTTYSNERGHPRLRMRHAHFPIDRAASERWLAHMRASLDEQALPEELDTLLRDYFEAAAPAMINTDG
ncbi:MAG: globin [Thermoleophilia bacterium]|nr:globin [Thermoleophilia bacterium]